MKNSDRNKRPKMASEKSLKEWKLPPSSASDFFVSGRSGCFSFLPNLTVNTVEKSIPLSKGFSTFHLFSKHRTRLHQLRYGFVYVGMVQVALKPSKLGSNASATVCLCDKRFRYPNSVLGKVESSLSDGPIYFSYFPGHSVVLQDSHISFCIDVKIRGEERVTLMYKFHYAVTNRPVWIDVSHFGADERGETTLYVENIEENNRVVSRKIRWGRIGAGEEEVGEEDEEALNSAVGGTGTNVDWTETAEAHVLKVDVPGLEIEQVKVEVEEGRVLVISGERGEEEEEDKDKWAKWHCVERSVGKFLRRVRLPENANMDQSMAAMKSGVLTVIVPKKEVVQNSKVRIISISG